MREKLALTFDSYVGMLRRDPLVTIDDAFLPILESLGEYGKRTAAGRSALAKRIKKEGTRVYGWLPSPVPVGPPERLKVLAHALWIDVVKPELERAKTHRPAIVRAIAADRFMPLMTRQTVFPELDDGLIRDNTGKVLGRIALTTDATLEAVRRGADLFRTVGGQKLVRALILGGFDAFERGDAVPNRVGFRGGMRAMLEAIGLGPNYGDQIRDIARAGQCIEWTTPHVHVGGLWTWGERRGTRAGPGEVWFTLGDALLPGYAATMTGKALSARMARRLVPELRLEPPTGNIDTSAHGAVWVLHRLWLLHFVDHAEKLAAAGFAPLNRERRAELARQAGLRPNLLERVMDAFVAGDDKAPPLLKRETDGRDELWTLSDSHEFERDFIVQAGHARVSGRKNGRTGVRTKRAKNRA